MRAVAERARRAIAASAERARVRWSFRVARGPVTAAVMEAVGGRDLISVGRSGWSRRSKTALGSTARAILCEARASALLLQHERRMGGPVCAVYDGSRAACRGLDAVARVARGRAVTVLAVAADEEAGEHLASEAQERLKTLERPPRVRRVLAKDFKTLLGAIRAEAPGLVVLPAERGQDLRDLISEIEAPILVVRDVESDVAP